MSQPIIKNKTMNLSRKPRCKQGTMKYKPLGDGCYTDDEINNFKANKANKAKKAKKTKKQLIDFEIVGVEPDIITSIKVAQPKQKKVFTKRRLKIPIELIEEMPPPNHRLPIERKAEA